MRKYLLVAVAAAAIATPALARDNSGYVGLDLGVLQPQKQHINGTIDFTTPPDGVTDFATTRVANVKFKTGYDADIVAGYDFGMFRLEAEGAYKRSKNKSIHLTDAFVNAFNAGAGTTLTSDDFDLGGHTSVLSGMVNALLDVGGNGGIGGYAGVGGGYARVKEFGESDSGFAWQLLAGVYAPISNNIDIGLKYRYFRSSRLNMDDSAAFTAGAGPCAPGGPPCSGGTATFGLHDRFTSHSLLASLVYNFGGTAEPAPLPPPPPPPPPAPEAPATQTCPDGSVILATSSCPLPPPPPPPPPVERGERGR